MLHNYDVFEKFPDGSTIWRACVYGRNETQRKMQDLSEYSNNEFYAIDILINHRVAPSKRVSRKAATVAASG